MVLIEWVAIVELVAVVASVSAIKFVAFVAMVELLSVLELDAKYEPVNGSGMSTGVALPSCADLVSGVESGTKAGTGVEAG